MAQTYNHDVAGMIRRMDRFIYEMVKSISSGLHQMNQFDQDRLQSYIDGMRSYRDWVIGQPQLDLPETSPQIIAVVEPPEMPLLENESLTDVVNLWSLARGELLNSQSSRQSSGLVTYDDKRVMAIIDKVESLLKNYIQPTTPLDLPESSPLQPTSGPGRVGV